MQYIAFNSFCCCRFLQQYIFVISLISVGSLISLEWVAGGLDALKHQLDSESEGSYIWDVLDCSCCELSRYAFMPSLGTGADVSNSSSMFNLAMEAASYICMFSFVFFYWAAVSLALSKSRACVSCKAAAHVFILALSLSYSLCMGRWRSTLIDLQVSHFIVWTSCTSVPPLGLC